MGFEEKFEQEAATTMDKINAFVSDPDAINKALDKLDNAISSKIVEGMDAADSAVHNLDDKIDEAIKTGTDKYEKNAAAVQNAVNEGLESAEGNYYAAQEMAKMAADRGESIVNSALIQAQMRMEDAKEKIDEKLDEMKKDADEADKE